MNQKNETLAFKVSAGLKNLIGRDLISDKYIAIFELVKNSYDANASNVKISYLISDQGNGKIIISDNGSGMTYNDIIQKWLFVAYSEKKPQNRSKSAYREEIKREVAGAKGVGRFSCDRLGASLQLITKTKDEDYEDSKGTGGCHQEDQSPADPFEPRIRGHDGEYSDASFCGRPPFFCSEHR